mgnify:FL=1
MIDKPITLLGKQGTSITVNGGTILVDFLYKKNKSKITNKEEGVDLNDDESLASLSKVI